MGGSAAEIPASRDDQPSPGLRASDAERDEVAARLRDEFVAGRLSHDTFVHRMDAVLGARRRADLPPLVADLPSPGQAAQSQAVSGPPARPLVRWFRGAVVRLTGRPGRPGLAGHQAGWASRGQAAGPAAVTRQSGFAGRPGPAPTPTPGLRPASNPPAPLALQFPRSAGGEFSIGRDASCDLAIADMTVSRRHATLERTAEGWLISDLKSTNGTRVNGWRVRGKVMVRPGDLISFGNLEAVFAREDAAPPAVLPAVPPPASPPVPPASSPVTRP